MKSRNLTILSGVSAIVLLGGSAGYVARVLTLERDGTAVHAAKSPGQPGGPRGRTGADGSMPDSRISQDALSDIPHHKSMDSLESLLGLDPANAYGRAAAWLADAGEEDIAAYWAGYKGGKRTNDMTRLVFVHWTRVDPRAAIAAVAGSEDEDHAWWAWAAHDPKGALAEAIAKNPDQVRNVMRGIGEFHPEWLRENFDTLPEAARNAAMAGMSKWADVQDPQRGLDFLLGHGLKLDKDAFLGFVRKDPWAAAEWLKKNHEMVGARYPGEETLMDVMISTLAVERLADLQRMAAAAPPGQMKRKMELAVFERQVEENPDRALDVARDGRIPVEKVERLARVSLKLLQDDPEKGFAVAEELMEAGGGILGYETRVEFGGGYSFGGDNRKGTELIEALFAKDPGRTVELVRKDTSGRPVDLFSDLVERWGEEDLAGLTKWADKQGSPEIRDPAVERVTGKLAEQGEYAEALDWAGSMASDRRDYVITYLLDGWSSKEPEAVVEWIGKSDLPEEERKRLLEEYGPEGSEGDNE